MQPAKIYISQRKGRMQLSISQAVLDRIEPLRDEVNSLPKRSSCSRPLQSAWSARNGLSIIRKRCASMAR